MPVVAYGLREGRREGGRQHAVDEAIRLVAAPLVRLVAAHAPQVREQRERAVARGLEERKPAANPRSWPGNLVPPWS